MKKTIVTVVITTVVIGAILGCVVLWRINNIADNMNANTNKNVANSHKVYIGMPLDSVLFTMDGASNVQFDWKDSSRFYLGYFHVNGGDGGSIRIHFDSTKKVTHITYP